MSVWGVYGVYMRQNKGNMIFLIFRYFRTTLARAPGFSENTACKRFDAVSDKRHRINQSLSVPPSQC